MVEILAVTPGVAAERAKWRYNGRVRPDFAEPVAKGAESVWDYPRPPRIEPVAKTLRVLAGERLVAETHSGVRVCETAGAPAYYFPPGDVASERLQPTGDRSVCEWKGVAEELSLEGAAPAAWRYVEVFAQYRQLYRWIAFYPYVFECYIGDERVTAQPGSYYGGWVTDTLAGPIKGLPGSENW